MDRNEAARAVVISADTLRKLSEWIDEHPPNARASINEQLWARTSKIGEEFGEVVAEMILFTGQNPRKGYGSSGAAIIKELFDVAVTALCAVEHIRENDGRSLECFFHHITALKERAGL